MASFKSIHLKLAIILLAFMICIEFLHVPVNGKTKLFRRRNGDADNAKFYRCYECNLEELKKLKKGLDCNTVDPEAELSPCYIEYEGDDEKEQGICGIVNDKKGNVLSRLCGDEEDYEKTESELKRGEKICKCSTDSCNGGKTCNAKAEVAEVQFDCYVCKRGRDCNTIDQKAHENKDDVCIDDKSKKNGICAIVNDEKGNVLSRLCLLDEEDYEEEKSKLKSGEKICRCQTRLCNDGKTTKTCSASTTKKENSFGLFWTTGLVLIGYSLSSVIVNARGSEPWFICY